MAPNRPADIKKHLSGGLLQEQHMPPNSAVHKRPKIEKKTTMLDQKKTPILDAILYELRHSDPRDADIKNINKYIEKLESAKEEANCILQSIETHICNLNQLKTQVINAPDTGNHYYNMYQAFESSLGPFMRDIGALSEQAAELGDV